MLRLCLVCAALTRGAAIGTLGGWRARSGRVAAGSAPRDLSRHRPPSAAQPTEGEAGVGSDDGKQWYLDLEIREEAFDDVARADGDEGSDGSAERGDPPATSEADGWEEPSAEEDEEGVVSVLEFLPELMRVKYGDDWEVLLMDEEEEEEEEEEDEEDSDLDFSDVISVTDEADDATGEDESEEALRERVRVAQAEIDEEGDGEYDDELEEPLVELDGLELPATLSELSPELAAFAQRLEAGEEELPQPFPLSEWEMVFGASFDEKRFDELVNVWGNLRVLLHVNFPNIEFPEDEDQDLVVEQRAYLKALAVHRATGLPAIAESTSVYVEAYASKPQSESIYSMSDEAEQLIDRMRIASAPERAVVFRSAAAYVCGNVTVRGFGQFTLPIAIAGLHHATVATSCALDDLFVRTAEALNLRFIGKDSFEEFYKLQQLRKGGRLRKKSAGAALLKEKLLREATVLDASILKVSSFLNHMVDVELMEACGDELAERLEETQPTKVLTVEATGLLPGMFVAKALQLPIVFARKSRQIGISDSYQTSYKSSTSSKRQDIYVSTEYLTPGDRVIIIDDFLAGGTTADALVRVCKMAGAKVVGCGFLVEKTNDAGRAFLSGYQLPLESLAVVEIDGDRVQIVEVENKPEDDEAAVELLNQIGERQREDDALDAASAWSADGLEWLEPGRVRRDRAEDMELPANTSDEPGDEPDDKQLEDMNEFMERGEER